MTLSGFALLWFVLAVGCVVTGTALTRRRAEKAPLLTRVPRRASRGRRDGRKRGYTRRGAAKSRPLVHIPLRTVRVYRDGSGRGCSVCARCAQPLEAGERFCGACGLYVSNELDEQRTRIKTVKRA